VAGHQLSGPVPDKPCPPKGLKRQPTAPTWVTVKCSKFSDAGSACNTSTGGFQIYGYERPKTSDQHPELLIVCMILLSRVLCSVQREDFGPKFFIGKLIDNWPFSNAVGATYVPLFENDGSSDWANQLGFFCHVFDVFYRNMVWAFFIDNWTPHLCCAKYGKLQTVLSIAPLSSNNRSANVFLLRQNAMRNNVGQPTRKQNENPSRTTVLAMT